MKHSIHYTIMACALAAIVIGCASTKSTENMLSAAGFKMVPATTPQQQAHLQTLPADKITSVVRNGTTYYVYPDPKRQQLYIGREAQYQQYQKLRLENQMAEEQLQAAEMGPGWDAWGPWGMWGP
jgi:hypothetical protein